MSDGARYVVLGMATVGAAMLGAMWLLGVARTEPRNTYVRDLQTGECRAVAAYVVERGECNPRLP